MIIDIRACQKSKIHSTMPIYSSCITIIVVLITIAAYAWKYLSKPKVWTLRGPKGIPFFGNLHQVFGNKPFVTFSQWAKTHGDLFRLKLGKQDAIVINSIEIAKEALVKHGKTFAGRPEFYTMTTLHKQERKFVFGIHNDAMIKLYRKTVLSDMRKRMQALSPIVRDEIDKMALAIFSTDSVEQTLDMRHHIHKMAANVAHGYAFGRTYCLDDEKLTSWMSALAQYRELLHWFRQENFLPFPQLFAAEFQTQANKFRSHTLPLYSENFTNARNNRTNKVSQDDDSDNGLLDTLLDVMEDPEMNGQLKDDDIISVLRDVMFGGSDGAFQPLIWIIMYVVKNPKIQNRICQEICDVVGSSRVPELSDRDVMPYVEATIREVLRHSEITSLGIPRRASDDVILSGHNIPKDTLTIVNVYSIHRDERHWQDPMEFNPQRFLDDNNELIPTADLSYLPFSTGHRSCVGQNIARANLFLIFVRFFQRFRVSATDEEIPEMINSGGAFNPDLKPFKVTLKLREMCE